MNVLLGKTYLKDNCFPELSEQPSQAPVVQNGHAHEVPVHEGKQVALLHILTSGFSLSIPVSPICCQNSILKLNIGVHFLVGTFHLGSIT